MYAKWLSPCVGISFLWWHNEFNVFFHLLTYCNFKYILVHVTLTLCGIRWNLRDDTVSWLLKKDSVFQYHTLRVVKSMYYRAVLFVTHNVFVIQEILCFICLKYLLQEFKSYLFPLLHLVYNMLFQIKKYIVRNNDNIIIHLSGRKDFHLRF